MEQYKRCPFCGSDAHIFEKMLAAEPKRSVYRVSCPDVLCLGHAFGRWYKSLDEAKQAWESRA